jgi:hypothetical protein
MLPYSFRALAGLSLILTVYSCNDPASEPTVPASPKPVVDTAATPLVSNEIIQGRSYNDVALYLAGIKPSAGTSLDSSLWKDTSWVAYSHNLEERWNAYEKERLEKEIKWANQELDSVNKLSETVFYPFSGPDFLNVCTFFPKAKKYVMIGLEPVGSLPDLKQIDSLPGYFGRINQSLHAILNFSFFRTLSMADDFNDEELNGTIHLLEIFAVRTKNTITGIQPVSVDTAGFIKRYADFSAMKKDSSLNKGVEIKLLFPDSTERTLYYFSVDLSNQMVEKNKGMLKYIKELGTVTTYLKGASYLMHKYYFSSIRTRILEQSRFLLQDDSGIPIRAFDEGYWKFRLFGTYTKPINLFAVHFQQDLKDMYDDSLHTINPKPLDFGIGYNWKKNMSNMMLAIRREVPLPKKEIKKEIRKTTSAKKKEAAVNQKMLPVKNSAPAQVTETPKNN